MKRAKCYIELRVGDGEGTVRKEAGVEFIFRKEEGESTTKFKYPFPDCGTRELSPSPHQYYFQTLPVSRPFAELVSFSYLTMKWFKQGNLYQPLKKFLFFLSGFALSI